MDYIIRQLSVFVENKSGRLNRILESLAKAKVRIVAAMVADTSEFGILRLITNDEQAAESALKTSGLTAALSNVIALECNSGAGAFADIIGLFSLNNISIEYMYCFSKAGSAFLILKTDNPEAAIKCALANKLQLISEDDLKNL